MREELIKSEFGDVMLKIQNLEQQNLDISKMINNAYLLQKEFRKWVINDLLLLVTDKNN